MDKKKLKFQFILIAAGIILILSGFFISGFFVVQHPDMRLDVTSICPQESKSTLYLTPDELEAFPELLAVLEAGGGVLDVYSREPFPDNSISKDIADRILEKYADCYLVFDKDTYYIWEVQAGYSMSPAEIVAAALKIFGWVPLLSGAVLLSVNFVRSVAPAPRRMNIQNYIEEHPGCSEADVVKNTGYSRNSAVHHIQKLVSENKIRETPYRKTVRYYPADESSAEADIINAARAKEKPAAIMSALEKKPMTLSELEAETGISASSLRWHLAKLEEDGIVLSEKRENTVYYSLSE